MAAKTPKLEDVKPLLTVNDIVRLTGRSRRTVIRWFENEPGTIVLFDHPEQMHKRRYRVLRVPRGVFEQVMTKTLVQCNQQ
jgi:hypothetical protein